MQRHHKLPCRLKENARAPAQGLWLFFEAGTSEVAPSPTCLRDLLHCRLCVICSFRHLQHGACCVPQKQHLPSPREMAALTSSGMKSTSGKVVRTLRPLGKELLEVAEDILSLLPRLAAALTLAAAGKCQMRSASLLLSLPSSFLPVFPPALPPSYWQVKTAVNGTGVAKPCDQACLGGCQEPPRFPGEVGSPGALSAQLFTRAEDESLGVGGWHPGGQRGRPDPPSWASSQPLCLHSNSACPPPT